MKIRFAIVGSDLIDAVRIEAGRLQQAVNTGDMDQVDDATTRLLALTADCPSTALTEQAWRSFLDDIRARDPGFQSGYLLAGKLGTSIFLDIATEDHVLALPIDDATDEEPTDVR